MALLRRSVDESLLALLGESGRNVVRTTLLLRELISDYPDRAPLAAEVRQCEHEGDRITHDVIHRLADGRGAAPAVRSGRRAIASRPRSMTSSTTPSRWRTRLASTPSRRRWSRRSSWPTCWSARPSRWHRRSTACARGGALAPHLVEIHRLENEGDRLRRDAVASLFAGGTDPMVVIRWRDIFESLEAAVDACETVAHILEGISLRRR